MGRVIGAVIAAYVVMWTLMVAVFSAAWMLLGSQGSFQPGTWRTSLPWIAVSLAGSLFAAVPASRLAAVIARGNRRALQGLVLLTLILGLVMAIPVLTRTEGTIAGRPSVVSMQAAFTYAAQPAWLALLMPFLGVVGAV